jgi:hypothetical protein
MDVLFMLNTTWMVLGASFEMCDLNIMQSQLLVMGQYGKFVHADVMKAYGERRCSSTHS